MPLFKSNPEPTNHRRTSTSTSPSRRGSIFSSRNRSVSPVSSSTNRSQSNEVTRRNGFFGHRNSTSSDDLSSSGRKGSVRSAESGSGGGFFGMGSKNSIGRDPTILKAREKVTNAEAAERDADRALLQAREMVKEAREHVKMLEREALEDARRAKAKQAEAKMVSKSASGLGRHG